MADSASLTEPPDALTAVQPMQFGISGKPVTPRVLILAEHANPEWTSVPLVGWSHARAIQAATPAHIVTQIRNHAAFLRAGLTNEQFTAIDTEFIERPLAKVSSILRGGSGKGWTTLTAVRALSYPCFEHLVWKRFESDLRRGNFDLVHRVTPLSPTMPSPIARRLAKIGVPFVIGPLNGGVEWPSQFKRARHLELEWLSYGRSAYKLLPGYRSTRALAAAIIVGSQATLEQMPHWCKQKCVYIPENAIDPTLFPEPSPRSTASPLKVAFVGRLVPYKGADMLLEAAAPLIKSGQIAVTIVGDGPQRAALHDLSNKLDLTSGVTFTGWIPHSELHVTLGASHVFAFPSVREFGGGAVLEAMALGLVPIVLDYGGPGELVTQETGFKVPMGDRSSIVLAYRSILTDLCGRREHITQLAVAARLRVLQHFSWTAKARQVLSVYDWVLGRTTQKPRFPDLLHVPGK